MLTRVIDYLKKSLPPILLGLGLCILAMTGPEWLRRLDDEIVSLQFKIRGERDLGDEFVLVFLGQEDLKALGGWPLTHDYYGYMTHALSSLGAKVIGFNLLFDSRDPRFPEYDDILADFMQTAGNVCLPVAFYHLSAATGPDRFLRGEAATRPIPVLQRQAAGVGFSNLATGPNLARTPVVAVSGTDTLVSFGATLAATYLDAGDHFEYKDGVLHLGQPARKIPTDAQGQLRLNHFGGVTRLRSIGFFDLLQSFESAEAPPALAGKIVLVDITAPGIPTLESTPLSDALPTSLIHATVAENILHHRFLTTLPRAAQLLLALLFASGLYYRGKERKPVHAARAATACFLLLMVTAYLLFVYADYVIPLMLPIIALTAASALAAVLSGRKLQTQNESVHSMLEKDISRKEEEIDVARKQLSALETQLKDKSAATGEMGRVAEERQRHILELEKQVDDLRDYSAPMQVAPRLTFTEIIHAPTSPLAEVLELVTKVAVDDIPIMISGETGTGKEMVAHAIHQCSRRKSEPFVAVNCGALSETLLESELFGHEKGSFTGANSRHKGRFELANGGTIFLDEITETNGRFQAQLLRVLQEGRFERLGGEQTIVADVRVVAATNRDLRQEVEGGPFRADLYFRLNGFPIHVPSLSERTEDIPLLVAHFLKKHHYEAVQGVSERAMQVMTRYNWPGNVRELENVVRRAAIIAQSEKRVLLQQADLPAEIRAISKSKTAADYRPLEDQILQSLRALDFSRSAITKTAEVVGNRDRGTITEHFRGICFKTLLENSFNIEQTARAISGTADPEVVKRVKSKIDGYLTNLAPLPELQAEVAHSKSLPSQFRGLPRKYHLALRKTIEHMKAMKTS